MQEELSSWGEGGGVGFCPLKDLNPLQGLKSRLKRNPRRSDPGGGEFGKAAMLSNIWYRPMCPQEPTSISVRSPINPPGTKVPNHLLIKS